MVGVGFGFGVVLVLVLVSDLAFFWMASRFTYIIVKLKGTQHAKEPGLTFGLVLLAGVGAGLGVMSGMLLLSDMLYLFLFACNVERSACCEVRREVREACKRSSTLYVLHALEVNENNTSPSWPEIRCKQRQLRQLPTISSKYTVSRGNTSRLGHGCPMETKKAETSAGIIG